MKNRIRLFCFSILVMAGLSAYSQKYKTAEDTGKLNLEYVKVSNDIADLTAQLATAQEKLVEYQAKSNSAQADAQNAANSSSDQASKATNGSVSDAKKANKRAKKAYNEAKDARSANNDVNDQNDKIAKLSSKLKKKQERLQELTVMRDAINAKLPN
ncbi:MAG: hypothetical protein ABI707_16350 [Ferruginibacter sp.]